MQDLLEKYYSTWFTLSGTFSDRDPYKIKKKFTSDLDDSKAREYKKLNSIDERSFYL